MADPNATPPEGQVGTPPEGQQQQLPTTVEQLQALSPKGLEEAIKDKWLYLAPASGAGCAGSIPAGRTIRNSKSLRLLSWRLFHFIRQHKSYFQ